MQVTKCDFCGQVEKPMTIQHWANLRLGHSTLALWGESKDLEICRDCYDRMMEYIKSHS